MLFSGSSFEFVFLLKFLDIVSESSFRYASKSASSLKTGILILFYVSVVMMTEYHLVTIWEADLILG